MNITNKDDSDMYIAKETSDKCPDDCDGCGREFENGESNLSGIEGCGGCYRRLCFPCVRLAMQLVEENDNAKGSKR